MDFFKSVFSEDPDPPKPGPESSKPNPEPRSGSSSSDPDSPTKPHESESDPEPESESDPEPESTTSRWSGFGGLIRTLAVRSESVIETYRRDLQEFGTGLKKEIEVAQGSLETVSNAIDEIGSNVIKGTAQIISQSKEAMISGSDLESDSNRASNSKLYNRFDSQVRAIQGDPNTYCDEPEDLSDYGNWRSGFGLEEKEEEIESLMRENEAVESIYKRVVPGSVDHQTFWSRYFYKVYKLKQTEDFRAKLVNRAILPEEEEELSWDFDDSDDEKEKKSQVGRDKVEEKSSLDAPKGEALDGTEPDQLGKKDSVDNTSEIGSSNVGDVGNVGNAGDDEKKVMSDSSSLGIKEDAESKVMILEEKSEHGKESLKGSDYSVVSSQPSMAEEEDLGWDEIEDLSSIDGDKKPSRGASPGRADLRKRLSVAEEEEDLSWDIEDDDEPVKA